MMKIATTSKPCLKLSSFKRIYKSNWHNKGDWTKDSIDLIYSMKTLKSIVFSILLIACNNNSNSFPQSGLSPEQIIETFFGIYDSEGVDPALKYVFSLNKWIISDKEGLNELTNPLKDLISRVGEYQGKELIVKKV